MHIKKIVRFEQRGTHLGMYSSDIAIVEELTDQIRHPCPRTDSLLWFRLGCKYVQHHGNEDLPAVYAAAEENLEKWFFGYNSKETALRWIFMDEWLLAFHQSGIVVSEYFCDEDDCVDGRTQSMFRSYLHRFSYDIPTYFRLAAAESKFRFESF